MEGEGQLAGTRALLYLYNLYNQTALTSFLNNLLKQQ